MIETTTHIAEHGRLTLCGLELPVATGARQPIHGTRVGLTLGRFTYSCYVTGENDSNAACGICAALWAPLAAAVGGIDSGFDDLSPGGAGR